MGAQERNAARYRLDGGLKEWQAPWVLHGPLLRCHECAAVQAATKAGEPFKHGLGCVRASDFAQYPWHDLAALLRDLPAVPA